MFAAVLEAAIFLEEDPVVPPEVGAVDREEVVDWEDEVAREGPVVEPV